MSTLQKSCRKELISSSYKKYINQLKIVLRADVMLLWLLQETHESAIFSHRMMRTGPSQAAWKSLSLPYTHPGQEGCPRKQLTLWLLYLLKAGVTS